jgi:Ca2+-binding RTX toxin-like protein
VKWLSYFVAGCLLVLALVSGTAGLANNNVETSHSNKQVTTRTIPELLPPDCAGMAVTAYVMGASSPATNSAIDEIIMGTSGVDTMDGGKGDDCLMGGAGNDAMTGGTGTDVCFGGPGTDTFDNSCETKIQ